MIFARQTSPRFVVLARGPRYGSRDEFVGWGPAHILVAAETDAWLNHLLDQFPEYYHQDLDITVLDTQPERDLKNWGPRLPWGCADEAASMEEQQDPNYLPF